MRHVVNSEKLVEIPYGCECSFLRWNDSFNLRMGYLSVAQDLGIEPIVVISPVSGKFYDLIGVGLDKRSACYDRIRDIAHKYQAKLIDFSSEEYTPYFLHDIVHFGWLGWVELEEALHREVSS